LVGHGIVRVERNGLGEVRDGAVEFALLLVGEAPAVVGDGIIRVERDGLAGVGDGTVIVFGLVLVAVGLLGPCLCAAT